MSYQYWLLITTSIILVAAVVFLLVIWIQICKMNCRLEQEEEDDRYRATTIRHPRHSVVTLENSTFFNRERYVIKTDFVNSNQDNAELNSISSIELDRPDEILHLFGLVEMKSKMSQIVTAV